MASVYIIYKDNGELKKTMFVYFDGASLPTIKEYFTRERKNLEIIEIYTAKDTDEMIKLLKENENGVV